MSIDEAIQRLDAAGDDQGAKLAAERALREAVSEERAELLRVGARLYASVAIVDRGLARLEQLASEAAARAEVEAHHGEQAGQAHEAEQARAPLYEARGALDVLDAALDAVRECIADLEL